MDTDTILKGRRITLGVTGSIAAYKACPLASQLTQMGARATVIMTESAVRFVSPLTFQALTGQPVYTNMWHTETGGGLGTHIAHVGLAHQTDLLLIAPATAHTIARLAHGFCDDLLSLTALAARCPLVIAPAMDAGMYDAAATQANIALLRERGAYIAGPAVGRMASGLEGTGRLLEPEEIIGHCRLALGRQGPLRGRHIVVTAGPTREPIDPVRFISNHSSGKQGFALAQAAVDFGADVTLIAGPVSLPTPVGVRRIDVASAREMRDAVLSHACGQVPADALIMSAAVADFRPAHPETQKIKKERQAAPAIELERNPDILLEVSEQPRRPRAVIGFAAETEDLLANARAKLARKKLDLIVANDVTAPDAGFEVDTNRVHLVTPEEVITSGLLTKLGVAYQVLGWLTKHLE
ncbi:MAG: bifunctional phosphopantothenoylcysteine decarboxylase/phosphopantothenate--cysteine ligase CoaBC [Anaerolineae bacterium]